MINREVRRCILAFKRRVVEEVESGKFASIQAAGVHHGTMGATTVNGLIRRFGTNHLLAKVVPVEQVDEADRVMELRREVARLERALGGAQAESLLITSISLLRASGWEAGWGRTIATRTPRLSV